MAGLGLSIAGISLAALVADRGAATRMAVDDDVGRIALALALLGAFALWERHVPEPLLDVRLFRNRRFSAASLSLCGSGSSSLFGFIFLVT